MLKFSNSKFNISRSQNHGYLLIESMIGISILVIGILGILNLLSRSASLNRVVDDQFIGNYLAAEGIEITKNLIDSNIINRRPWNSGFSNGSFEVDYTSLSLRPNLNSYLLFNPVSNFYGYQSGDQTPFIRKIDIILVGSEEIRVNSIVKWTTRGNAQFEVNLEDHFFNWRP